MAGISIDLGSVQFINNICMCSYNEIYVAIIVETYSYCLTGNFRMVLFTKIKITESVCTLK